jgi:hypothetical protein
MRAALNPHQRRRVEETPGPEIASRPPTKLNELSFTADADARVFCVAQTKLTELHSQKKSTFKYLTFTNQYLIFIYINLFIDGLNSNALRQRPVNPNMMHRTNPA